MNRRKIESIGEIYNGENLLIKDFSNMDLTNIDLSSIPPEKWEECIFYNTSFKNTGIKFVPKNLYGQVNRYGCKEVTMDNCDFSNNDLSYLNDYDKYFEGKTCVSYKGCNFRNTKFLNIQCFWDVLLDEEYAKFDFEYWSNIRYLNGYIDWDTVKKNPFLKIPSYVLLRIINNYTYTINWSRPAHKLTQNEIESLLFDECEKVFNYDKQGYIEKLYNFIKNQSTIEDRFLFFRYVLRNQVLDGIDTKEIPFELLRRFWYENCTFKNVTIHNNLKDLLTWPDEHLYDLPKHMKNEYPGLYLPGITFGSWKDNDEKARRISLSSITFLTKVYLELSRACNAKCPFCRNSSFESTPYDLESIKQTLNDIKAYLHTVVIGGGEPTLILDDIKQLYEQTNDQTIGWHLFTNGSNGRLIQNDYFMERFKINLSRHAIDDRENAGIFGIDSNLIMCLDDVKSLNQKTEVTLNATCFEGGLDSFKKIIDYIEMARKIGIKKVLIQDLQQSISLGAKTINYNDLCINPIIFELVMKKTNIRKWWICISYI